MLSDGQIISVLKSMEKKGASYEYHTMDRDIYLNLDEVRPYVSGFKNEIRGFSCQGLSAAGSALLESK